MVKNRKDSPENGSQTCSNMLAVFRREAHANFESLERNRVSNVSFTVASVGEVVILAIMVGILKGVHSDASTENNTKAFSILIAFAGGVWCECTVIGRLLKNDRLVQCSAHFHGSGSSSGAQAWRYRRVQRC